MCIKIYKLNYAIMEYLEAKKLCLTNDGPFHWHKFEVDF